MGLVMAIVFGISTFSAIYFKILSDAILDREQYKILTKIGMTKKEIGEQHLYPGGHSLYSTVLIGYYAWCYGY